MQHRSGGRGGDGCDWCRSRGSHESELLVM